MKKQTKRFYSKFDMENMDKLNVSDLERVISYLDRGREDKIRCVFGIQSKDHLKAIVKRAFHLTYFKMTYSKLAQYNHQINQCSTLA